MKKLIAFVLLVIMAIPGYSQVGKAARVGITASRAAKGLKKSKEIVSGSQSQFHRRIGAFNTPVVERSGSALRDLVKENKKRMEKAEKERKKLLKDSEKIRKSIRNRKSSHLFPSLQLKVPENPLIGVLETVDKYYAGEYDTVPELLLLIAVKAEELKDTSLSREALKKAEKQLVSPETLLEYTPQSEELKRGWRNMTIHTIDSVYKLRLAFFDVPRTPDQREPTRIRWENRHREDSVWESIKPRYLEVARLYAPEHIPLLNIASESNILRLGGLYQVAIDSLILRPNNFSVPLKNHLIEESLGFLPLSDDFDGWFDRFEKTPLKEYVDTLPEYKFDLWQLAFRANDKQRCSKYFRELAEENTELTNDFAVMAFRQVYDYFIADPKEKETADWLMDNGGNPLEIGAPLVEAISKIHLKANPPLLKWGESSELSPELIEIHDMLHYIIDRALEYENSASSPDLPISLRLMKCYILVPYPEKKDEFYKQLKVLKDSLKNLDGEEVRDLKMSTALLEAYIEAQGNGDVKKGIKILNKNASLFDAPGGDVDYKAERFNYLYHFYSALNKRKEAEKALQQYNKLIETQEP